MDESSAPDVTVTSGALLQGEKLTSLETKIDF